MPDTPLLELRQLTKSFGGARALRGVDFDLRAGEVHALLGENGAGKSTLIKIVTGAHQPDGGTITVAGQRIASLDPAAAHRLGIACIYQQPALFPDLTVAENIALRLETGPAWRKVDWTARTACADELLQRVGAAIPPATEVRALSMPEQQLIEIACALGAGARIVLMDEPTASLTQKEQHLLFAVVRDLRARGVGVIYISHRLEEIFALADRVTVLRDGESVGTLSAGEMTETTLIRMMVGRETTQIHPPAEAAPGEVVLALRKVGCAASGVSNVTFDVRAGEVFGLAGLAGAGRTELARILFGITPADTGEILLRGERILPQSAPEAVALGVAYVPEDRRRHGVVLEMPVEENITMAVHRQLFPRAWLHFGRERSLAMEYVRKLAVKCSGPAAAAGTLSGGNQQKVSLARWLATRPKVLILDEPTQGVDIGAKGEIHKIIRQLARDGIAVVLISSDLVEILGVSDRIGVMRGGTLTAILPGRSDAHTVMTAALGQFEKGAA
ncbi:MAG: sugar ABC transporter ATP-binding protein [Opitutaceae bacterium]